MVPCMCGNGWNISCRAWAVLRCVLWRLVFVFLCVRAVKAKACGLQTIS